MLRGLSLFQGDNAGSRAVPYVDRRTERGHGSLLGQPCPALYSAAALAAFPAVSWWAWRTWHWQEPESFADWAPHLIPVVAQGGTADRARPFLEQTLSCLSTHRVTCDRWLLGLPLIAVFLLAVVVVPSVGLDAEGLTAQQGKPLHALVGSHLY